MDAERCIKVFDKKGNKLEPCTETVANVLISRRRAVRISENAIKIILDKRDLKRIKKRVIERDKRVCFYCGKTIPENEIATVDHVNPKHIAKNGRCGYDTEENMVCACLNCNNHKDNRSLNKYIIYRFAILIAYACFKANISSRTLKEVAIDKK